MTRKRIGFLKEAAKKRSITSFIERLRQGPLKLVDDALRVVNKRKKFAAPAMFAPGIPESKEIKPINIKPGFTRVVIQEHHAKRAGKHYDLRIQSGQDAHSWALRELPTAHGERTGAIEQPTHKASYMDFEGELPAGYGAGKVRKVWDENVDIVSADNKKIKFVSPTRGEFALINTGQGWMFLKMKKFEGSVDFKPKYKEQKDLDPYKPNTIWMPKIDGAHTVIEFNPKDKMNRLYSYRRSKKTGLPIEHTHQVPKTRDIEVPKSVGKTVVRAELFARDHGKAIDPSEVSGILNSSLIKSREKQEGKELLPMIFDITKFKGRDVSKKPYGERLEMIRTLTKNIPVDMPEVARTPAQKKKLIDRIRSGRHQDTDEGVVEWDLLKPQIIKSKIRPEDDVYVKSINPNLRGFAYSVKKGGPVVGRVGTGFSQKLWSDMRKNPENYEGRVARIASQGQFESGAHRAPAFKSWHVEKNLEKVASSERRRLIQLLVEADKARYFDYRGNPKDLLSKNKLNQLVKKTHPIRDGNKIVGFTIPTKSLKGQHRVGDIWVTPSERRKGHATRYVKNFIKEHKDVPWFAHENNIASKGLAKKLGYEYKQRAVNRPETMVFEVPKKSQKN